MGVSFYQPWGNLAMPRLTRAVRILLVVTVAVFLLQFLGLLLWDEDFARILGLGPDMVRKGYVWQIVTYMFLHGGLWHLFMNMLMLYMLGAETERTIGTRRFLLLYFGSGILGGLGWLLLAGESGGICVGASGAVFGVVGACAALFPRQLITFWYFLPLTMTIRTFALVMGGIAFASLVMGAGGNIAHAAHLAGGVAGYLYGRRLGRMGYLGFYDERPGEFREFVRGTVAAVKRRFQANFGRVDGPPTREEVDRVLDKLAKGGWSELTKKDRDLLDRASKY